MNRSNPYAGLLCIGDPHLASRNPGFRKDDYPRAVLDKLGFCLEAARRERLLPILLGDVFHWPRDNANRLLTELLALLAGREVFTVAGNHDMAERGLRPDDSLSVVIGSGRLTLLDASPRVALVGPDASPSRVVLLGSSWGEPIPEEFEPEREDDLVVWIAHHDVRMGPGSGPRLDLHPPDPPEEDTSPVLPDRPAPGAWIAPREIPGVDIVVNGHLHAPFPPVKRGGTTWLNPGNIARVKRSDIDRAARPAALRILIGPRDQWDASRLEIPHAPFEEVFHLDPVSAEPVRDPEGDSAFVRGLEALRATRTSGGAGLLEYLERNLARYEPRVADELRSLALAVTSEPPADAP